MKIGIFIHLFNLELLDEFKTYIHKVQSEFGDNIFILFTMQDNDQHRKVGETNLKFIYPYSQVLYIENKGVDFYSLLKQIEYIREREIKLDYILKIHTKISTRHHLQNWRKQLILPITDPSSLKYIHHIISKKAIGYIAAQICNFPRTFDIPLKSNLKGIYNLTKQFPHINENYLDFIAGSMFWINYSILESNFTPELIHFLSSKMTHGKPPSNFNKEIYPEYVMERLITGPLCFNYTNLLVNENKVETLNNTNLGLHRPYCFSFHNPKEIMETFFPEEKNNLINLIKQ